MPDLPQPAMTLYIDSLPVGTITMWAGQAHQVPEGWHICDGTKGTPNLQDNFPCGVPEGSSHLLGTTQPAEPITLKPEHLPAHTHEAKLVVPEKAGADWRLMHPLTYATRVKAGDDTTVYDRNAQDKMHTVRDVLKEVQVKVESTPAATPLPALKPVRTYVYFIMKLA